MNGEVGADIVHGGDGAYIVDDGRPDPEGTDILYGDTVYVNKADFVANDCEIMKFRQPNLG